MKPSESEVEPGKGTQDEETSDVTEELMVGRFHRLRRFSSPILSVAKRSGAERSGATDERRVKWMKGTEPSEEIMDTVNLLLDYFRRFFVSPLLTTHYEPRSGASGG